MQGWKQSGTKREKCIYRDQKNVLSKWKCIWEKKKRLALFPRESVCKCVCVCECVLSAVMDERQSAWQLISSQAAV